MVSEMQLVVCKVCNNKFLLFMFKVVYIFTNYYKSLFLFQFTTYNFKCISYEFNTLENYNKIFTVQY